MLALLVLLGLAVSLGSPILSEQLFRAMKRHDVPAMHRILDTNAARTMEDRMPLVSLAMLHVRDHELRMRFINELTFVGPQVSVTEFLPALKGALHMRYREEPFLARLRGSMTRAVRHPYAQEVATLTRLTREQVQVTERDTHREATLLMVAVEHNAVSVVEHLLTLPEDRASIPTKDALGDTVAHYSARAEVEASEVEDQEHRDRATQMSKAISLLLRQYTSFRGLSTVANNAGVTPEALQEHVVVN